MLSPGGLRGGFGGVGRVWRAAVPHRAAGGVAVDGRGVGPVPRVRRRMVCSEVRAR